MSCLQLFMPDIQEGIRMDIAIESPVRISMNVIEFDEHVPSMRLALSIVVKKFSGTFSVDAVCWMECSEFDAFMASIRSGENAKIVDMNREFSILIDVENVRFLWSLSKKDIEGGVVEASGNEILRDGDRERILSAFESYPKWW